MDEGHLISTLRYVERNPVRAKMVLNPWDWPWSSAPEHVGEGKGIIRLNNIKEYIVVEDWMDYLRNEDNSEDIKSIRQETRSRRVLGSRVFIDNLERKYGITLNRPKMGRPKMKK